MMKQNNHYYFRNSGYKDLLERRRSLSSFEAIPTEDFAPTLPLQDSPVAAVGEACRSGVLAHTYAT